MEDFEI
jgi:hypothetical protein